VTPFTTPEWLTRTFERRIAGLQADLEDARATRSVGFEPPGKPAVIATPPEPVVAGVGEAG